MKKWIQIPIIKIGAHGGTRVLIEFANHMARRGYGVRLIYPKGRFAKKYDLESAVERVEMPATGIGSLDSLLFLLLAPFTMRRGILVANFFVTFYPVWIASLLFRCPYIYIVQDIENWYRGAAGSLLNLACRLTWQSKRMVSSSPHVAAELERRGYTVFAKSTMGVAPAFYAQAGQQPEKKFDIIIFPRRETWKRMDRLLAIIMGYRGKYGSLRVLCVAQKSNLFGPFITLGCECLRPASEAQLIDAYDSARVALFTSEREGMGLPPLEGMARGLPAVVYRNGGSDAYMRDGENGFHIDSEDDAGAIAKLQRLLSEPDLYAVQSRVARETAKNFSMAAAFDALEAQF